MTNKKTNKSNKLVILLIALSIVVVAAIGVGIYLLAGNDDNDNNDNNTDNTETGGVVEYTVTVLTPLGAPVSDVLVSVHHDNGSDYNVCTQPITTNASGKAVFSLESGKQYSVGLMGYPSVFSAKSGNNRAERYALDSTSTVITLGTNDSANPSSYSIGDFMANFTITDIDGNSYELYELLETKKAVVLNYWFYNCDPCRSEFPAMNSSYNTHKDSMALFALNDLDSLSTVQRYESDKGLSLDMPLVKISGTSQVSSDHFDTRGYYPATIVINCYGQIAYAHSGSVPSVAVWNALFDYFTADSYNGGFVTDINDIL